MPVSNLLLIYTHLIGWTTLGWILARFLPKPVSAFLGKFLFWVGVPISILAFLRGATLSVTLWMALVVAWAALLMGLGLAWWVARSPVKEGTSASDRAKDPLLNRRSRGSFLLTAMIGNTGYIGYPVALTLVGPKYFAWALVYDIGSTLGAYSLGVILAAHFGMESHNRPTPTQAILKNPALWSFIVGLTFRNTPLPAIAEVLLHGFAWSMVSLALILVGMRLSQLSCLRSLKLVSISLTIKMLLVPLVLGAILSLLGINGSIHRILLLQMAMPPAFATLVISEAYNLDQELAVTALAVGSVGLVLTLPLWLWLFG